MIPQYPTFTKLVLHHQDFINALTSRFEPYSDFNFISLFSWDTDNQTEVSLLNNNLVIRLPDYISGEPVISILGDNEITESVRLLLGQPAEIKLVPEEVARLIDRSGDISVTHDPDNDDYIYDLRQLADLPGGQFKKKRNKLNTFMVEYGDRVHFSHTLLEVKPKAEELKRLFDKWAAMKERNEDDTANEKKAIDTLLDSAASFNLKCYETWIDDTLVGFSINEVVPKGFAVCHFQKTLFTHVNLDIYINVEVAKQLLNEGCSLVNWEQDLGIEGLRQTKLSYHPTKTLKKYRVQKV